VCDDPMYATELTHTFALEIALERTRQAAAAAAQGGASSAPAPASSSLADLYRRAKVSQNGYLLSRRARHVPATAPQYGSRLAQACNDASTANPEYSGVILACGGQLAMEARRHGEAYTLFLAAFSHFENAGHASKLECVKRCAGRLHRVHGPSLAEIALCHACSDHEILRVETSAVHCD
jgi:hypothetical protein